MIEMYNVLSFPFCRNRSKDTNFGHFGTGKYSSLVTFILDQLATATDLLNKFVRHLVAQYKRCAL